MNLQRIILASVLVVISGITGCVQEQIIEPAPTYVYGTSYMNLLVGADSFKVKDTWNAGSTLQYNKVVCTQSDSNEYAIHETTLWDQNALVECLLPYTGSGIGSHTIDTSRSHMVTGLYSRPQQQAFYGPVKGQVFLLHDSSDYVEGTIDAVVWDDRRGVNLSFTGSFKVKR